METVSKLQTILSKETKWIIIVEDTMAIARNPKMIL